MNVTFQDRLNATAAKAEARLQENKGSVKTYATYNTAKHKADVLSSKLCTYWEVNFAPVAVVALSNGRFFIAADLVAIHANSKCGGYLFACLDGHFTVVTEECAAKFMEQAA